MATAYDSYDALGRVTRSRQVTGMQTYRFGDDANEGYAYLSDGSASVTRMRYPSGRVVTQEYDDLGRPRAVNGQMGAALSSYVDSVAYTAEGMPATVLLSAGRMRETSAYQSGPRQLTEFKVERCTPPGCATSHELLKLNYTFQTGGGNAGGPNNNGNPRTQTIHVPGGFTVQQTYGYDGWNRLTTFEEPGGAPSETYCYDAHGNRAVLQRAGLPVQVPQVGSCAPSAVEALFPGNRLSGLPYEAGGALVFDGVSNLRVDAEDRLRRSWPNGGTPTEYSYDGEGRRVKKATGGASMVFVYDAFGRLAAEYGGVSEWTGRTIYLHQDHLGSTRLVTDPEDTAANPPYMKRRRDYWPFGLEFNQLVANESSVRTAALGYAPGGDPAQKFTGKERDGETGLDNFVARYYSASHGRFTSPDPITATPLRIINPQRWNMYAYAVNNALSYVDPDGRDAIAVNLTKQVPIGGHSGIISVHSDGSARYASFGPRGGGRPFAEGEVKMQTLHPVQLGANGLPTDAAYKHLAEQAGRIEGQDASTIRMNYFKTSEAETAALDHWMERNKTASDRRKAATYDVTRQNCAAFCVAGLIQANAIQNRNISLVPNILFQMLTRVAADNYPAPRNQSPREQISTQPRRGCLIDRETGECVR